MHTVLLVLIANAAVQDAMARLSHLGKPDLFISLTCNANWPEIVSSLLPGQTAADHPDIVARVFIQKVKQLLHLVVGDPLGQPLP